MKTIEQIVAKLRSIELEPVNVGSTKVAFSLPDPDLLDEIADALEAIQREALEPRWWFIDDANGLPSPVVNSRLFGCEGSYPLYTTPQPQQVPDDDLPGLWENADFSGGETDSATQPQAGESALWERIDAMGNVLSHIAKRAGVREGDVPALLAWADRQPQAPDVDWLANVIREVDGKHDLGAGALAEKIIQRIAAAQE